MNFALLDPREVCPPDSVTPKLNAERLSELASLDNGTDCLTAPERGPDHGASWNRTPEAARTVRRTVSTIPPKADTKTQATSAYLPAWLVELVDVYIEQAARFDCGRRKVFRAILLCGNQELLDRTDPDVAIGAASGLSSLAMSLDVPEIGMLQVNTGVDLDYYAANETKVTFDTERGVKVNLDRLSKHLRLSFKQTVTLLVCIGLTRSDWLDGKESYERVEAVAEQGVRSIERTARVGAKLYRVALELCAERPMTQDEHTQLFESIRATFDRTPSVVPEALWLDMWYRAAIEDPPGEDAAKPIAPNGYELSIE